MVGSPNPQMMKAKLTQSGLHLTLDWVTACLQWLTEEQPGIDISRLLLAMQEQWLSTDIRTEGVMDRPVLPPDLKNQRVSSLPSGRPLHLQVLHGHDIGSPAYGQLQKLHQVDVGNAAVSEDDTQATQAGYQASQGGRIQAAWEPKASRVMFLTLTDGFQTVEAMEHETVSVLPNIIEPGLKIEISGTLVVRRGIILLSSRSVRVLGGGVEELKEQFSLEKILEDKIGKKDVGQNSNRFCNNDQTSGVTRQPITTQTDANRQPITAPTFPSSDGLPPELDDDDDDLLLAASQSADFTESRTEFQGQLPSINRAQPLLNNRMQPPSNNRMQPSSNNMMQPYSNNRVPISGLTNNITKPTSSRPAVAVVQPLIPVNRTPKGPNLVQSTLGKHLKTISIVEEAAPSFDLDLEFDDDFPTDEIEPPPISTDPFTYIVHLKEAVKSNPERSFRVVVKAVSSTLSSKMSIHRTSEPAQWRVGLVLNDGSASLCADLSPVLLDSLIGPAAEYIQLGPEQADRKIRFREKMRNLSSKLASLSSLVTIVIDRGLTPQIVKMEDISGLHLAQMRKRRLMS